MIFRIVCVILVTVLNTEALPVPKKDLRPTSINQAKQNLLRPPLGLPVGQSPRIFSSHPSSPIDDPATEFSDMWHGKKKKSDGFITSRSMHSNIAQRVKLKGQRDINAVRHSENRYRERMQHVMQMIENKFSFAGVKDRMRKTFLKKKTLMDKLHGFGGPGKFVGIPYHTMNDDHMIVKKPGVDFNSPSLPNIGISVLTPTSAVQTIATQLPALPEVTTSVELHQEWEPPATMDGYVFPITSIPSYAQEVKDTTEIMISIGQEKSTTPQLTQETFNFSVTTIPTHPEPESTTLKASVTEMPHYDIHESTEAEMEMISTSIHELSTIKNDDFDSVTSDPGMITENGSTLFLTPSSTETILQIETTLRVDLFSDIQVRPITNSVIDMESMTNEIGPTFSPGIMTGEGEFTSTVIDADTTNEPIIPMFSSTTSAQTILGTEETWPHTSDVGTSTVEDEISTIVNTASTSSAMDPELISEPISLVSFMITTERPVDTTAASIITDIVSTPYSTMSTSSPALEMTEMSNGLSTIEYNRFESDLNEMDTTFEVDSTSSSAISSETSRVQVTQEAITVNPVLHNSIFETEKPIEIVSTSSFLPSIEITTIPNLAYNSLSENGYNRLPSFTDKGESTDLSTLPAETIAIPTEGSVSVDEVFDYSIIIEPEKSTEMLPNFSSIFTTETATALEEVSSTGNSDYRSTASDRETTSDNLSTVSSTISSDTTTGSPQTLATTPFGDLSSRFGYYHFPSFTHQMETTTRVDSTSSSTIPIEMNTVVTEMSTTVNPVLDISIIETERTTEILPTFPSKASPETAVGSEEIFTSTSFHISSFEIVEEVNDEVFSKLSSIVPIDATLTPVSEMSTPSDALPGFGYNHFTSSAYGWETTTGVHELSDSTLPTEATTVVIEIVTTADSTSNHSTTEAEISLENVTELSSTTTTEVSTTLNEISITTNPANEKARNDRKTSTILPEIILWSESHLGIPVGHVLPTYGYNHFPSWTNEVEITTQVDSTFLPAAATTVATERLTTGDTAFDISPIDTERTTEIVPTFFAAIPTDTANTVEAISTTTLFDASTIDKENAVEVIPIFSFTFPTETTSMPVSEVNTPLAVLSMYEHNRFNDATISSEQSTVVTEKPATSAFNNSELDPGAMTDTDSMFTSGILTEKTTSLEKVSSTTDLPFDLLANSAETTSAQDIWTFQVTVPSDNEAITGLGNISRVTYPASTGFTNDGETTTEIDSALSATILTETTVVSDRELDTITEQKFENLDEKLVSDDKRNGRFLHTNPEPTWPRFSHNSEEEPSEKTSLDLIPMIVEYYAKIM